MNGLSIGCNTSWRVYAYLAWRHTAHLRPCCCRRASGSTTCTHMQRETTGHAPCPRARSRQATNSHGCTISGATPWGGHNNSDGWTHRRTGAAVERATTRMCIRQKITANAPPRLRVSRHRRRTQPPHSSDNTSTLPQCHFVFAMPPAAVPLVCQLELEQS